MVRLGRGDGVYTYGELVDFMKKNKSNPMFYRGNKKTPLSEGLGGIDLYWLYATYGDPKTFRILILCTTSS